MPSIPCHCHHTIATEKRPLRNAAYLMREDAFTAAVAAARDVIATRPLDKSLTTAALTDCFHPPANPANRLAVQCPHCARLHVLADTWRPVQLFRPETAALPAGATGRGATGLFGYPPETTDTGASTATCPCGQHLDVATRPHPRGVVSWHDTTNDYAYSDLDMGLRLGDSRDRLASSLFEYVLGFENPNLRYGVQCPTCARLLLLNDNSQITYVFADNPDKDPLENHGRGSNGLFDDDA